MEKQMNLAEQTTCIFAYQIKHFLTRTVLLTLKRDSHKGNNMKIHHDGKDMVLLHKGKYYWWANAGEHSRTYIKNIIEALYSGYDYKQVTESYLINSQKIKLNFEDVDIFLLLN